MPQLVAATDEQKRERDALTFPEWGQRLTLAQWLEREAGLRAHRWSRAGMETWLWRADDGEVLASCETFNTSARLGGRAGAVYSVASVFTAPALRGHRYATQLLNAVCARLEQRPGALGSVLYSDVGTRIYERAGYRAFPAFDVVLTPEPGDAREGVTPISAPLSGVPTPSLEPDVLAVTPDAPQLDWHLERERFYARVLGLPGLAFHGARSGAALGLFAGLLKSDQLVVLWLVPGSTEETLRVLRCAQRLAHAAGLKAVHLWEPHSDFAALPGRRSAREGGIPMLRSFGERPVVWRHVHRGVWV